MAYVTPPTFTAGSVLSAAQLNIIGDDITFLKGVIDAPVACVNYQKLSASGTAFLSYRHNNDGLVFKYDNDGGVSDDMYIAIYDDSSSWRTIYSHGAMGGTATTEYWSYTSQGVNDQRKLPGDGTGLYSGVASTVSLTVGNHYEVAVVYTKDDGNSLSVSYMYNTTGTAV